MPAAHELQLAASTPECFPLLQAMQSLEDVFPVLGWYLPTLQLEHVLALTPLYLPVGQVTHFEALAPE